MTNKPVFFSIIASFLYAAMGVVLVEKLVQRLSTPAQLLLFYAAMVPCALIHFAYLKWAGDVQTFVPSGGLLWTGLAVGVVFYAADFFLVAAFEAGGTNFTVRTIMCLGPVFAAIFAVWWNSSGQRLNAYHLAAFGATLLAVVLSLEGNRQAAIRAKSAQASVVK